MLDTLWHFLLNPLFHLSGALLVIGALVGSGGRFLISNYYDGDCSLGLMVLANGAALLVLPSWWTVLGCVVFDVVLTWYMVATSDSRERSTGRKIIGL